MDEQNFRLSDIRRMFKRRAKLAILLAGACTLAAILVAAFLPNRYQAATTLLIEPQSISKRLVDAATDQGELSSRLHLMTMQILSRARLSRVIDDLNLYQDLSDSMTREDVISYMRSQIWVEPVLPALQTDPKARNAPEINTFRLYFRHESPRTVAAVANRLANDFIDEHIRERVQVSGDTAEFIDGELTRLSQRIREVETQIAQIKSENVGSLPENRMANESLQQRTLDAMREAQRRLSAAESDADFYRQQATLVRSSESGRGDVVGRTVSPALRSQELEMRLAELRARGFTDRHPDVVTMNAELEELKARLAGGEAGDGSPVSVAEQEARALSKRAALSAEAERKEIERLRAELAIVEERLARTPRVAEQLDGLMREYESLSLNIASYSNKRLDATVAANMERRQKGEQFRVLEPAVPPSSPESPNRPLIVVIGLLLGLALGGGAALLLEATDSSFHEPRSLQEGLRIPVLASIPGIQLAADIAARRRRHLRELVAAAAVSGVILVFSAAGYVYVNGSELFGRGAGTPAAAPGAAPQTPPPAPAATPPGAGLARPAGE